MFVGNKPIISSLLDTDLYKFTMQQVVLRRFPTANVEYAFKCRNKKDLAPYLSEINRELDSLCELTFSDDELSYLKTLSYLNHDYIEFLRGFKLNRKHIEAFVAAGELQIRIKGSWFHTILFEVPVLSIVNEVYTRNTAGNTSMGVGRDRLDWKIYDIDKSPIKNDFNFIDFGTRRRFSAMWQDEVVKTLSEKCAQFKGTSNVLLAKKYNVTPVGTMAHEFLQAAQGLGPRIRDSQKYALENWVQEYRGQLGIALSDVVGMDAFLKDFDLYFAKLFDGARHDSGDPYVWTEKLIAHYKKLDINPQDKIAVYSDGLTVPKALALCDKFKGQIKTSFGIGTNLTNDFGHEPLQIVIKMVTCNGQPVAKVSDSEGKQMCEDEKYLAYLREVFEIGESK